MTSYEQELKRLMVLAAAMGIFGVMATGSFQHWPATIEAAEQVSSSPSSGGRAASDQVNAQTSAQANTVFEEASIRPCDPNNAPPGGRGGRGGGANTLRMTPGRTSGVCLTLATLIRTAYGAGLMDGPGLPRQGGRPSLVDAEGRITQLPDPRDFSGIGAMTFERGYYLGVEDGIRVRGGPDWVRSELYTVEAVAPASADAQTMRGPMLRALLERRFGLKVHVETEQITALKLTVAPGGLKIKEGTCTKSDVPREGSPAAAVAAVRRNLDAARRGATTTGPCGQLGAMNGPNLLLIGAGFPVPALADGLAVFLDAPVIDQTGIPETTLFNYVLEFVLDDSLSRKFREQIPQNAADWQLASDPSTVPRAPGIHSALEQQLGLRLERVRAPREFIVIDKVERPSPN